MKPGTGRPDRLPASEIETVTRLKHQIAGHSYRVDAHAVAREILFKLRMISLGRRTLLADAPESSGPQLPTAQG
jgi:hypothetical protein